MIEVDAVEAVEASVLLPSPALETSTADAVPAVQGEIAEALAERWLQYLDVSPKTSAVYNGAIRVFLRWLRERGIATPSRTDILAYRDWLKQDHAPATVSLYMTAVRLFFAWAEQEGLATDVARRVKGSRIDRGHKKDSLTSAQATRLLESVDRSSLQGLRDYAILALMVTTGLRTISVVRANVEDLGTSGDAAILRYQGKAVRASVRRGLEPAHRRAHDHKGAVRDGQGQARNRRLLEPEADGTLSSAHGGHALAPDGRDGRRNPAAAWARRHLHDHGVRAPAGSCRVQA